ncbi:RNA-dependent RNA polymerase 1 [Rhizophagus clarus]|uniref:RNA-dependent RNA polymerase n=1 Tax=Rhizophagus clarus TaxID=94130 RepID=A0A8H3QVE6_9GLOM|nr:RNA-dependent RNA polymerase 1 [Rhizophagus clarus]
MMCKVVATPTIMYISTPTMETSNRVIHHFHRRKDNFLRVQFVDEASSKRLDGRFSTNKNVAKYATRIPTSIWWMTLKEIPDVVRSRAFQFRLAGFKRVFVNQISCRITRFETVPDRSDLKFGEIVDKAQVSFNSKINKKGP